MLLPLNVLFHDLQRRPSHSGNEVAVGPQRGQPGLKVRELLAQILEPLSNILNPADFDRYDVTDDGKIDFSDLAVVEEARRDMMSTNIDQLIKERDVLMMEKLKGINIPINEEDLATLSMLAGNDLFDQAMVQFFRELPSMFQSENYDITLTGRVIQPLTPLWAIYQMYKLSELEVDIARVEAQRDKSTLVFQVQEIYLRILQAQAGQAALHCDLGADARRNAIDRPGDRRDVIGRGPAAAADDVEEARLGPFPDLGRHRLRGQVVLAELVGQAGIRMRVDVALGDT